MRLILSPLKFFLKSKKKKIFLGAWCLNNYDNKNEKILSYHWSNSKKRLKDNKYLDLLLNKIHYNLRKELNKIHNTNFSQKFWDIILFPWTSLFVPIIFDRWESLNKKFEKQNISEILVYKFEKYTPEKNFNTFLENINDHLWNHKIFSDILIYKNEKKLKIHKYRSNIILKKTIIKKPSYFNLIIDFFFSKIKKENYYIFINSCFSNLNFLKLNLSLKQPPRLFYEFYKNFKSTKVNNLTRSKLKININKNRFEKFLSKYLILNLPISFLEDFNKIIQLAKKIKINSKVIITGNHFFPTELARFWSAIESEKGTPIILSEHGGSIPFNLRYFNKIDKIFDKKITWSKPINFNEIQATPSKFIGLQNLKSKKKYISIITLEKTLYAHSCNAIQSSNILEDFDQKKIFLNELIKKNFKVKIKPYRNYGWNLERKYQSIVGEENIFKGDIKELFTNSKLNVCTYPETTFLESFLSGVPTILIYLKKYYNFNKKFISILKKLEQNKIVFSNPLLAADHVKNIYNDPSIWWNSKDLKKIRKEFFNNFGKVSKNWITEWKDLIISLEKKN